MELEECDYLGFHAHMKYVRGWPKRAREAKWLEIEAAPDKYRCRVDGKGKLQMVWVPRNRKLALEDVLACHVEGESQKLALSDEAQERLLFGQSGGIMPSCMGGEIFGGPRNLDPAADSTLHIPLVGGTLKRAMGPSSSKALVSDDSSSDSDEASSKALVTPHKSCHSDSGHVQEETAETSSVRDAPQSASKKKRKVVAGSVTLDDILAKYPSYIRKPLDVEAFKKDVVKLIDDKISSFKVES